MQTSFIHIYFHVAGCWHFDNTTRTTHTIPMPKTGSTLVNELPHSCTLSHYANIHILSSFLYFICNITITWKYSMKGHHYFPTQQLLDPISSIHTSSHWCLRLCSHFIHSFIPKWKLPYIMLTEKKEWQVFITELTIITFMPEQIFWYKAKPFPLVFMDTSFMSTDTSYFCVSFSNSLSKLH